MAGDDPAPPQLIRYQLGNHLGSCCLEQGIKQIISYEEYSPYGNTSYQAVQKDIGVPFVNDTNIRAKERDEETGFTYHNARYYAPCWTVDIAILMDLKTAQTCMGMLAETPFVISTKLDSTANRRGSLAKTVLAKGNCDRDRPWIWTTLKECDAEFCKLLGIHSIY